MLLVGFCWPSYLSSDLLYGRTDNVAKYVRTWDMSKILPPEAGLEIQGVFHRYTITKEANADATVSIVNKNANSAGNIYEAYNYRFDPCFIPLADPSCPDYESALYKYLLDNNLINNEPDVNDPYYNQWVQFQLELKAEQKEEEDKEKQEAKEEEQEELKMEKALSVAGAAEQIANPTQQLAMMQQLASTGTLDVYYGTTIEGGKYEDTVTLEDSNIEDNTRALRNLAQDTLHRTLVRSQYDK